MVLEDSARSVQLGAVNSVDQAVELGFDRSFEREGLPDLPCSEAEPAVCEVAKPGSEVVESKAVQLRQRAWQTQGREKAAVVVAGEEEEEVVVAVLVPLEQAAEMRRNWSPMGAPAPVLRSSAKLSELFPDREAVNIREAEAAGVVRS